MSDYDSLYPCEKCGYAYTLGRICESCAQQEQIDNERYASDLDLVLMMGSSIYADTWYGVFCHARNVLKNTLLHSLWHGRAGHIRHKVRYLVSAKYRALMDEIPF